MQVTQIRPRKGGKTAQFALNIERAGRVRRVIQPMDNDKRLAGYVRTNGADRLTGKQIRRLARHDASELPGDVRFMIKRRDHSRKPIRQSFGDRIDNQRKPTGRVGAARWGPQQGIAQLNQLLFGSRKGSKGMDLGENAAASQLGRMQARTAHGRRRYRRQRRG